MNAPDITIVVRRTHGLVEAPLLPSMLVAVARLRFVVGDPRFHRLRVLRRQLQAPHSVPLHRNGTVTLHST